MGLILNLSLLAAKPAACEAADAWRRARATTSRPTTKLRDFKTRAEQGPPPGTIYNYPPRDAERIASIAAAPAPPNIAVQIYTQATMTKMIAHCTQGGESIDKAIAWAADELEGFMRS